MHARKCVPDCLSSLRYTWVSTFKDRASQRSIAKAQRPGGLKAEASGHVSLAWLAARQLKQVTGTLFQPGQGLYFCCSLPPGNHVAHFPHLLPVGAQWPPHTGLAYPLENITSFTSFSFPCNLYSRCCPTTLLMSALHSLQQSMHL